MSTYHIAFATDDNYAPYLSVAVTSFLETRNNRAEWVIHILTDGLLPENRQKLLGMACEGVEIVIENLSERKDATAALPLHRDNITTSAYYRLYLPEILPALDKVLYLDCDVLVFKDLSPLFELDLQGRYAAAVQDLGYRLPDWPNKQIGVAALAAAGVDYAHYFNSGIIMMNLELMRLDNLTERMVEIARNPNLMEHDQDVLNIACKDKWVELPMEWNYSLHVHSPEMLPRLPQDPAQAAIAHFTTFKPWNGYYSDYAMPWCECAVHSPFYEEIQARMTSGKLKLTMLERLCLPVYCMLEHMPFLPASLVARAAGKSELVKRKMRFRPCARALAKC